MPWSSSFTTSIACRSTIACRPADRMRVVVVGRVALDPARRPDEAAALEPLRRHVADRPGLDVDKIRIVDAAPLEGGTEVGVCPDGGDRLAELVQGHLRLHAGHRRPRADLAARGRHDRLARLAGIPVVHDGECLAIHGVVRREASHDRASEARSSRTITSRARGPSFPAERSASMVAAISSAVRGSSGCVTVRPVVAAETPGFMPCPWRG